MLTREQLQQNIEAMEKQGASQQDIQGYLNSLGNTQQQVTPQQPTVTHGGITLNALSKAVSSIFPGQKLGEAIGTSAASLYARATGKPDQAATIAASQVKPKQVAGDLLKIGGVLLGAAAAPATVPGAIGVGGAVGASQSAGQALVEDKSYGQVAKEGLIGGAVGAATAGAISGIGALLGKMGDKITTQVIRPTAADKADGFSIDTIKQYKLGGSLNKTLDKTQEHMTELSYQLADKLRESPNRIDLTSVVDDTIKELTDSSKLKGFGANVKIQNTLQALKEEANLVGTDLSIPEAQVVKQAAGGFGAWQYGRPDPEAKATEIVYNTFYRKLKEAIEQNSPEGVREINREIAKLIPVMNAVIRRLPVAERNNLISLSDMVGLIGSTAHPAALGPTLLNLISKSGNAGAFLSSAGPAIQKAAVPLTTTASSVIGQQQE